MIDNLWPDPYEIIPAPLPAPLPPTQTISSEEKLVYRSDFSVPSDDWLENTWDRYRSFRKSGYYHISVNHELWSYYRWPNLLLTDFKVLVNAEFDINSGRTSDCGIVFRGMKVNDRRRYYRFSISFSGYYSISINEEEFIQEWRPTKFIKRDNSTNSLMVEMKGPTIITGINGHILDAVTDSRLVSGKVGLIVSAGNSSFAEVRFRDFRLYSL